MTNIAIPLQESYEAAPIPELTSEMRAEIEALSAPFKEGDPFDRLGYLACKAVRRPASIYGPEFIRIPIDGEGAANRLGVSGFTHVEHAEAAKEAVEKVVGKALGRKVEVGGWGFGPNPKTGKKDSFMFINLLDRLEPTPSNFTQFANMLF